MRAKDAKTGDVLSLFGVAHVVDSMEDRRADGAVLVRARLAHSPACVDACVELLVSGELDLLELQRPEAALPQDETDVADAAFIVGHPGLFEEGQRLAAEATIKGADKPRSQTYDAAAMG